MVHGFGESDSGGPYFDDLSVGEVFDNAPAMTLTDGVAALHQAIVGDRMRLPLDATLAASVTGVGRPLAHPGLVSDVAVGQSTVATRRVKANLFYRGLTFYRFPHIGDTLSTSTQVVALRENSPKPGRDLTGLAALRVTTVDQNANTVLDFHRCAMLPLSPHPPKNRPTHNDDMSTVGQSAEPSRSLPDWNTEAYLERVAGHHFSADLSGRAWQVGGDVVSSAPELARLTLNIAATHHDERIGGRRLVYGGHTIGIALAQVTRVLPNLVTVLGWRQCDHLGPVYEGDTLASEVRIVGAESLDGGRGGVLRIRSLVNAYSDGVERAVLDWSFDALMFTGKIRCINNL
jgi:acyl dehydratase